MHKKLHKTFIHLLIAQLILLFFITSSYAAQSKSEQKAFLWKVQSKEATAYILGSIHLLKKEMYPLNKKIEQAFDKSNTLVVEVNINNVDKAQMSSLIQSNALYPAGTTLQAKLSKETYSLTQRKLKEFNLPIEQFHQVKPWILAVTLETMKLQKLGFDPELGIDRYFLDRAANGKQITELETFDYQLNLFNGFSDQEQDLFLLYTIKELNTVEKDVKKIIAAWSTGNAKSMEALLTKSLTQHPNLSSVYDKLYYVRNVEMAVKIDGLLKKKGDYFIVVGAGHLVGKKGIIELLKGKGYTIEQL